MSFCQNCILRISGKSQLRKIIDNSLTWNCYSCDGAPLKEARKLCEDLCEYYKMNKLRRKRMARELSRGRASSDTDNDGVLSRKPIVLECRKRDVREEGSPVKEDKKSEEERSEGSSREAETWNDESDKENREEKDEVESIVSSSEENEETGKKGKESISDDDDARKMSDEPTRQDEFAESDSSASDGDSPQIDTDDISMSDVSLLDDSTYLRRKKRGLKSKPLAKEPKEKEGETGTSSAVKKERISSSSSESSSLAVNLKTEEKKKTSRISARLPVDSDSEDDFSICKKPTPRKRALSSLSTSSQCSLSRTSKDVKKTPKAKKSHLLKILSSESDSDKESPQKVAVPVFNDDDDNNNTGDLHSPGSSPSLNENPIGYTMGGVSSSDSDDLGQLGRKRKTNKMEQNLSGSEEKAPEVVKRKRRLKGKKRERVSSGDDFESGDMVLRGPHTKKRRMKRALLLDSDSETGSSDEMSEQEEEEKKEEKDKEESDEEADKKIEEEDEKLTPGRKRKKIRKLLTDAKLQDSTREAQRIEKERIERLKKNRLAAREKIDELVFEVDSKTKKVSLLVLRDC